MKAQRSSDFANDDRPPLPQGFEVEQAVLAAVIQDNTRYDEVAQRIGGQHFFDPFHSWIWSQLAASLNSGGTADCVTLRRAFDAEGLDFPNGRKYLVDLQGDVANWWDRGKTYMDHLESLHQQRELIFICEEALAQAYERHAQAPAKQLVENVAADLQALQQANTTDDKPAPFHEAAEESVTAARDARKHGANHNLLPTGFPDLDRLIGGFPRPSLVILGGRPSMGKTAFVLQMAYQMAKQRMLDSVHNTGARPLFFSLEMQRDQLADRVISRLCKVPVTDYQKGRFDDIQDASFTRVIENTIKELPLFIDHSGALTVPQMHARARQMKRTHGVDFIIIDHLGYILPLDRRQNRTNQVTEITAALVAMAKDLKVPVFVLSQLNRAVETRDVKRPTLADLRDSGSIEQDANLVLFVHRDEYYVRRELGAPPPDSDLSGALAWRDEAKSKLEPVKNQADIIVAKNRNGPIGAVKMRFSEEEMRFDDLTKQEEMSV